MRYRPGIDPDWVFAEMLDAYQAEQAEQAMERAEISDRQARRPEAIPWPTTFEDLRAGDYMTAEDGERARWVEVVEVERRDNGIVKVTFKTPQALGVGMHSRWVIDRPSDEAVIVDGRLR